jgi:RimJ/RimL family protein N-acetyltransferase
VTNTQGILLGGDPRDNDFFRDMNRVLREETLPARQRQGKLDYVVFYPVGDGLAEAWECAANRLLEGLDAMTDHRLTFRHDLTGLPDDLPAGLAVVSPELLARLARTDEEGVESVREEICSSWASVEAFFDRGFGTVALGEEGQIMGWCLTDWVVGSFCEVGIETFPAYRRRGWGKRMAIGTLLLALHNGLSGAGWQCWTSNAGSIATAYAAGFRQISSFPVRFGWCETKNNHLVNGTYWLKGRPDAGIPADPGRSAHHYQLALGAGWDWGGTAWLYWNAACAHARAGIVDTARTYLIKALELGWRHPESIAASPPALVAPDDPEVAALFPV